MKCEEIMTKDPTCCLPGDTGKWNTSFALSSLLENSYDFIMITLNS
jgi:hypothetical protein